MKKKINIRKLLKKKIELSRVLKYVSTIVSVFILIIFYQSGIIAPLFINGEPITLSEIRKIVTSKDNQHYFDQLIAEKLIVYEAKKRDIDVRKEEIDDEIKRLEKQAIDNGVTLIQLLKQKDTTIEELERNTRTRLLLYKILSEDIDITEWEIDEYLKQNPYLIKEGEEEIIRNKVYEILLNKKASIKYDSWIKQVKAESEVRYIINF